MNRVDLYEFLSKNIEVTIYRKRYKTDNHIKVFTGRLSDIGSTMICIESNGRYTWIPRPSYYRDKIEVIK